MRYREPKEKMSTGERGGEGGAWKVAPAEKRKDFSAITVRKTSRLRGRSLRGGGEAAIGAGERSSSYERRREKDSLPCKDLI